MRRSGILIGVLLTAAVAPARSAQLVVEKIKLSFTDPEAMFAVLDNSERDAPPARIDPATGNALPVARRDKVALQNPDGIIPTGIQGLLAFASDKSLLVRGTPDAVELLKDVVRFLDVERSQVKSRVRLTIRPKRGRPETMREEALKLEGAGKAEVVEGGLALEGGEDWVNRVLRAAARVEFPQLPKPKVKLNSDGAPTGRGLAPAG